MDNNVVVEADPKEGPLTAVKGMLLQSSLNELKTFGHYDEYCRQIEPAWLQKLVGYIGGEWVPIEAMIAHYAACDRMLLTPMQLDAIGRAVGDRLRSRLLTTLVSSARTAGLNPWTAISSMYRMTERVFEGSTARVVKAGPKDMDITVFGNPLAQFSYFRNGYCGSLRAMVTVLGARSSYAKITSCSEPTKQFTARVSWV